MYYEVVPIAHHHIGAVVAVHLRAFPGFFLSALGPRFLGEFYKSFLMDPEGIGYVAVRAGSAEVLGVVVGPFTPAGYFARLLRRRWWAFIAPSVLAILRDPRVGRRLLRATRYRGEAPPGPTRALLSSIAVAPEAAGRGVGRALISAWVDEVGRRGRRGCYLVTDADNNDAVNGFYLHNGWSLESSYYTPEGRRMNRYTVDLA